MKTLIYVFNKNLLYKFNVKNLLQNAVEDRDLSTKQKRIVVTMEEVRLKRRQLLRSSGRDQEASSLLRWNKKHMKNISMVQNIGTILPVTKIWDP